MVIINLMIAAIQGVTRRGVGVNSRVSGEHGGPHGIGSEEGRRHPPQHQPPQKRRPR